MKNIKGFNFFNATPHPVNLLVDGEVVTLETDVVINAVPEEQEAGRVLRSDDNHDWAEGTARPVLVRTVFKADEKEEEKLNAAYAAGADIVLGSIIAAQAYPGRIYAMVPAPGFERVSPDQERMQWDKFTTF